MEELPTYLLGATYLKKIDIGDLCSGSLTKSLNISEEDVDTFMLKYIKKNLKKPLL